MSRDLLFEIGVEELPAGYIPPALEQLEARRSSAGARRAARLAHGAVRTCATPRRLALLRRGASSERQPDRDEEVRARPRAWPGTRTASRRRRCSASAGQGARPRRRAAGRDAEGRVRRGDRAPGGQARARGAAGAAGRPGARSSRSPSPCAGSATTTRFARPVRWLVALLGDEVLPVRAFGLEAGRDSRGHRFLAPGPVVLTQARGLLRRARGAASVLAEPPGAARAAVAQQIDAGRQRAGRRRAAPTRSCSTSTPSWSSGRPRFAGLVRRALPRPAARGHRHRRCASTSASSRSRRRLGRHAAARRSSPCATATSAASTSSARATRTC